MSLGLACHACREPRWLDVSHMVVGSHDGCKFDPSWMIGMCSMCVSY